MEKNLKFLFWILLGTIYSLNKTNLENLYEFLISKKNGPLPLIEKKDFFEIIDSKKYCKSYNNETNECLKCQENYSLLNGECVCYDRNCLDCSSSFYGGCLECYPGYALSVDNTCRCKIPHCLLCSDEICNVCEYGYSLTEDNTSCLFNYKQRNIGFCSNSSCDICTSSIEGACIKCIDGFNLINGTCIKNPSLNLSFEGNAICDENHISGGEGCNKLCLGANCLKTNVHFMNCDNNCVYCKEGILYEKLNCSPKDYCYDEKCTKCRATEIGLCDRCDIGYRLFKGRCEEKCLDENCLNCDYTEDGSCNWCKRGFSLINGKCYKKLIFYSLDEIKNIYSNLINKYINLLKEKENDYTIEIKKELKEKNDLFGNENISSKKKRFEEKSVVKNNKISDKMFKERKIQNLNGINIKKNTNRKIDDLSRKEEINMTEKELLEYQKLVNKTNELIEELYIIKFREICKVNNCTSCLINNQKYCLSCEEGYSLLEGKCIPCQVNNCSLCLSNNICNRCKKDYALISNQCIKTNIPFCLNYEDKKCTQCEEGYNLENERCNLNNIYSQNTSYVRLSCSDDNLRTKTCMPTYFFKDNNCSSCSDNKCSFCYDGIGCILCQAGTSLIDGRCLISTEFNETVEDCVSYDYDGKCLGCDSLCYLKDNKCNCQFFGTLVFILLGVVLFLIIAFFCLIFYWKKIKIHRRKTENIDDSILIEKCKMSQGEINIIQEIDKKLEKCSNCKTEIGLYKLSCGCCYCKEDFNDYFIEYKNMLTNGYDKQSYRESIINKNETNSIRYSDEFIKSIKGVCYQCGNQISGFKQVAYQCEICFDVTSKVFHFKCGCALAVCKMCFNKIIATKKCPGCRKNILL